jgi:tRNA-dihydrouridine synthase B
VSFSVSSALAVNNRWLAPMAGVGDPVFRALCLSQGAGLTCTEMISAKGLGYGNAHTHDMLVLAQGEERCAVQLFGSDPALLAEQARRIEEEWGDALALIDVNMGCPVPKVTRKGEGAALMRTPELAGRIVAAIAEATSVPVTAKFRSGWDASSITAPEFARRMEQAGASAVCVHGRTASQGYSGASDPEVIARTVRAVDIPVLASGDLFSREDIDRVLELTGAAGALVARGACGNPWIFGTHVPTPLDRIDMAVVHARGLVERYGNAGLRRMRRHLGYYLTGFPYASRVRDRSMHCATFTELEELLLWTREQISGSMRVSDPQPKREEHAS